MRAYNDWHLEAWCGAHPDRFVPNQIAYLRDPEIAAEEIRRNAERGFKAVTFSEAPDKLGLPTIHSGYWDPLFAACAETGTVLCLHVGSSGTSPTTSADAPPEIPAVLFGAYGMYSAVDWLYSKVPGALPRHPHLPVGRRHRLGRRHPRPPRPLLPLPARIPADVARRRAVAERGPAPQLLVLRARRRRGHARARSHRRRPHPRRVRLPARRLVVAGHASDARPPAPRPGRARARRRAHHVAERVGAVPAPGSRACRGDRHDRGASSLANARDATPTASRSSKRRRAQR